MCPLQAQGEGAWGERAQVPHMGTTLKPILSPYGTLVCLFGGQVPHLVTPVIRMPVERKVTFFFHKS